MSREEELIDQLNRGDRDCLDELIRLYYQEILRYCLWHTRDRFSAEDAAQETFLKAVRYLKQGVFRGNFKAFLYRIAGNICIDLWRKKGSEELAEDITYSESGFDEAESGEDLARLVKSLTPELREIILLRFAQELTLREIAQVTGKPLRTVQSRLRSALKILKKEYRPA